MTNVIWKILLTVITTFECVIHVVPINNVRKFEYTLFNHSLIYDKELMNVTIKLTPDTYDAFFQINRIVKLVTLDGVFKVRPLYDRNHFDMITILERSMAICTFLENPISDPFAYIIYTHMTGKATKLFKKCPIAAVSNYTLQKMLKFCFL